MIHVYYGDGKGKTSILNGSIIRAYGAEKRILYVQFLKNRASAELETFRKLNIPLLRFHDNQKFTWEMNKAELTHLKNLSTNGFREVASKIKNYDFICLDEVLDCLELTLIPLKEFLIFLNDAKQLELEILISGHYQIQEVFVQADLISYVKKEKHYFDKGIQARRGIEF